MTIDRYFAGLADKGLAHESLDKIRDVLASILKLAIRHRLLVRNPMEGLALPRGKRTQRTKPCLNPEQFKAFVELIPEPYASALPCATTTFLPGSLSRPRVSSTWTL